MVNMIEDYRRMFRKSLSPRLIEDLSVVYELPSTVEISRTPRSEVRKAVPISIRSPEVWTEELYFTFLFWTDQRIRSWEKRHYSFDATAFLLLVSFKKTIRIFSFLCIFKKTIWTFCDKFRTRKAKNIRITGFFLFVVVIEIYERKLYEYSIVVHFHPGKLYDFFSLFCDRIPYKKTVWSVFFFRFVIEFHTRELN